MVAETRNAVIFFSMGTLMKASASLTGFEEGQISEGAGVVSRRGIGQEIALFSFKRLSEFLSSSISNPLSFMRV